MAVLATCGDPPVVNPHSRSGWQLVPSKPLDDHADKTLGRFSRYWPSVAHRSGSEVEVRVGGPTSPISDYRLSTCLIGR